MTKPQSYSAAFATRAAQRSAERALAYLDEESRIAAAFSYADLDRAARRLGAHLAALGLRGERALILLPTGLDYVVAFLGCLYSGVIAVPLSPPRLTKPDARLQAIMADCRPAAVLTTSALTQEVARRQPGLRQAVHPDCWIDVDLLPTAPLPFDPVQVGPADLAFLQYTSGSTGAPKGVMVTHRNLLDNCQQLIALTQPPETGGSVVTWLPLFHDMGLIGCVLFPLFAGLSVYLLAPANFLQRPLRWLEATARFQGIMSAAPNFALELCTKRATPELVERLDLSSWAHLICGSEPIQPATLERFAATFAPAGFRPQSLVPAFGMAEATLFVTGFRREGAVAHLTSAADALARGAVRPPLAGEAHRTLVSCGSPPDGTDLRIVDPDARMALPEGRVGELWIQNRSVAAGYWGRPDESRETFSAYLETGEGPFLRTGDLGFLVDQNLYISGRRKDVIILRGANHYPQDLERTVEGSHPALRPSGAAAFALLTADGEAFGIGAEIERSARRSNLAEVAAAVRMALVEEHGIAPMAIILLSPGTLPKTSSGKIRRHACREGYEAQTLDALYALIQNRHVPEWGLASRMGAEHEGE